MSKLKAGAKEWLRHVERGENGSPSHGIGAQVIRQCDEIGRRACRMFDSAQNERMLSMAVIGPVRLTLRLHGLVEWRTPEIRIF